MTLSKSGFVAAAFCLAALLVLPATIPAQITFERTYGGASSEWGNSVQQTADGGYVIAGATYSYGAGEKDIYIVKTDADGNLQWSRTYGGVKDDEGWSILQTADGGYVVAVSTESLGVSGSVYLIKTNEDGDTLWTRTLDGSGGAAHSIQQTYDGGFIVVGSTWSLGGGSDAQLIGTNAQGVARWQRAIGGAGEEWARSVRQTADSGYVVAGSRDDDVYLIRTDAVGETLWTRTFAESLNPDEGHSVLQTADGGYVICGYTLGLGAGEARVYLIKTDASGDTVWTRTFGGEGYDYGYSILETGDSGFLIAGQLWVSTEKDKDVYLIRTAANGDTIWTRSLGGAYDDCGRAIQRTSDGGYIIAGGTHSFGSGYEDVYLIKTDSLGRTAVEEPKQPQATSPKLQAEPNPCRGRTAISFQFTANSSAQLSLFDATGRLVLSRPVRTSPFILHPSALPAGVYLARLDCGAVHATTRLVVQK